MASPLLGQGAVATRGYNEETSPFDSMAADYDRDFTRSLLGKLMRDAIWARLDSRFQPGDRILELNCGTGEDAVYLGIGGIHVLATDISGEMVAQTRAKAAKYSVDDLVEARPLAIEDLGRLAAEIACGKNGTAFDGALSNFGGLNCAEDITRFAADLAACLRPGAVALLCVMGPACPWEWAWYLGHGQPRKAFRRLRRGGVPWRGLTIRYPGIGAMRRAFATDFRVLRFSAVGALIPPPYMEEWASRHERFVRRLAACERRFETYPPLPSLADHYLLELERL